jgi:hypothetical protein
LGLSVLREDLSLSPNFLVLRLLSYLVLRVEWKRFRIVKIKIRRMKIVALISSLVLLILLEVRSRRSSTR